MLRFTESVKTPRLLDKRCAAAQDRAACPSARLSYILG